MSAGSPDDAEPKPQAEGCRRSSYALALLVGVVVLFLSLGHHPKDKASSSPIIEAFRAAAESAAEYVGLDDDADEEEAEKAAAATKDIPLPAPQKFEDALDPAELAKLEEPPAGPDAHDEAADVGAAPTGTREETPTEEPPAEPEAKGANKTGKVGKDAKKAKKNKKNNPKPVVGVGIVDQIMKKPFTTSFDRCALVGSAAFMKGRKLGNEIGTYDTIIRVNRIPTKEFFEDFGNRTDVLFTGLQAEGYKLYGPRGMWYRNMGGKVSLCRFQQTDCPFGNLVLKGSDSMEYGQAWEARYPLGNPGWKPSKTAWPLAHQSEVINQMGYALTHPQRPSNGFHAFVTFGLMCRSLTLYGFSGEGTADGHRVNLKTHNMDKEHAFYRDILKGKSPQLGVHAKYFMFYLQRLKTRSKSFKIIKA